MPSSKIIDVIDVPHFDGDFLDDSRYDDLVDIFNHADRHGYAINGDLDAEW